MPAAVARVAFSTGQVEAEEATELSIKYEIAVVPLFLFFKARIYLLFSVLL